MKNRMCFYLDSAAQENTPAPEVCPFYLLNQTLYQTYYKHLNTSISPSQLPYFTFLYSQEDTVYLYTSEPLTVAVMEFGGYAMKDSVWLKKSAQFAKALGKCD